MDTMTEPTAAHHEGHREFVREAVTMALYLSLSLLAVLLAIPSTSAPQEDPVSLVFLTAVGLLVAHLLASAISSRLVSRGMLDGEARLSAFAQVAAGAFVIGLVMIPMILFDAPTSIRVAEGLLLAFVAWMGYLAARQADVSVLRSWMYVLSVIVSVLIVLALKAAVGH